MRRVEDAGPPVLSLAGHCASGKKLKGPSRVRFGAVRLDPAHSIAADSAEPNSKAEAETKAEAAASPSLSNSSSARALCVVLLEPPLLPTAAHLLDSAIVPLAAQFAARCAIGPLGDHCGDVQSMASWRTARAAARRCVGLAIPRGIVEPVESSAGTVAALCQRGTAAQWRMVLQAAPVRIGPRGLRECTRALDASRETAQQWRSDGRLGRAVGTSGIGIADFANECHGPLLRFAVDKNTRTMASPCRCDKDNGVFGLSKEKKEEEATESFAEAFAQWSGNVMGLVADALRIAEAEAWRPSAESLAAAECALARGTAALWFMRETAADALMAVLAACDET